MLFPLIPKGEIVGKLALFGWIVATSVLALISTRSAWRFVVEDASIDMLDVSSLEGALWLL